MLLRAVFLGQGCPGDLRRLAGVLPAHQPRWAISAWYHHGLDDRVSTACGGGDEDEGKAAVDGAGASSGMSESSLGNTTEEIESFLLAMMDMKGDGGHGERFRAQPKAKHYAANLKSW